MSYASTSGRARTSARNPRSFAVCHRCGTWYNRIDLQFQRAWRGAQIQDLYILVCKQCYDIPNEQLRAITLPAAPVPIYYPSVEDFDTAETDYRATSMPARVDPRTGIPIESDTLRITQDLHNRTTEPFGRPEGQDANAVMPLYGVKHLAVPLNVLSVSSNGTATITVTCSSVTGLCPDSQVSVLGLSNSAACGFYSVCPISATAFTYQTYGSIAQDALLTGTTRIITADIGLPRGYKQIPKIHGPPLWPSTAVCFFENEAGDGIFLLENGDGYLQLQSCTPGAAADLLQLESSAGVILLEDGSGAIELQGSL